MLKEYIDECPLLSAEEERVYIRKAQGGDKKSYDYLVLSNSRLVNLVAVKLRNKGLDHDELFQVGVMGLMKAIDRFNLSKPGKLVTYAYIWIRQYMLRAIHDLSRTIRIPDWIFQSNFELIVARKKLELELERKATNEELVEYTGKTKKEIENFTITMVDCCSLDKIGGNSDADLINIIPDENIVEMTSKLINDETLETIRKVLNEREFNIFTDKLGLINAEKTFEAMAKSYGVTKQALSKNYRNSILKLKSNSEIKLMFAM